jgi:hypothetical protein
MPPTSTVWLSLTYELKAEISVLEQRRTPEVGEVASSNSWGTYGNTERSACQPASEATASQSDALSLTRKEVRVNRLPAASPPRAGRARAELVHVSLPALTLTQRWRTRGAP